MTNALMATHNAGSRQPAINLLVESFKQTSFSKQAKSAKHHRSDFAERLRRIRKLCEFSYHKALLNYVPEAQSNFEARPALKTRERGVWYNDTHLLCRRSDAAPLLHSLHNVLGRCQYAVSVGDEFDFGWSEISDPIAAALDYKTKLARRYPNCKFHTVFGNHDGSEEYFQALERASIDFPNILVHRYAVKLGGYLFTHGDCIHWKEASIEALDNYRRSFNEGWSANMSERIIDRIIHTLGIHRKIPEYFLEFTLPRKIQAERIIAFIKRLDSDLLEGVQDICFGHTHKGFRGFVHKGFRFHNGGAHERGFRPVLNRFSIKIPKQEQMQD